MAPRNYVAYSESQLNTAILQLFVKTHFYLIIRVTVSLFVISANILSPNV